MEYDSLSRCHGGEMVDTRDSKSRAKERGGSMSPLQGGSRNLGDFLYPMNGESALKSPAPAPTPPKICFNRITQGVPAIRKALFLEDLSRVWYCIVPLQRTPNHSLKAHLLHHK
ncbi:hypothetical protein HAX54_013038 [Datura stramonium]|uniref:Uncharacterized protein n=1 Tax=Datura stramonium TaxID=4076 RepID=A0ABS8TMG7_DATST|nr:hypothetical protein [Datura stramonium]